MKNYFVNTYVRDKKRMEDLLRWCNYGRKRQLVIRIIWTVYFVLCGVYSIFSEKYTTALAILVFVALLELLVFIGYKKAVKLRLQRDAECNQGQPVELTIIVREDTIRIEDATGQGNDMPLSQMKWAVQTKKMVIICTKAKLLYALPNDTFTQGSAEELITYLRAKGIGS